MLYFLRFIFGTNCKSAFCLLGNFLNPSDLIVERAKDVELPYIYKESGIKNLNIIRFKVPQEDKDFLEYRVTKAIELINK